MNTQANRRALGKRPHSSPVIAPPIFKKRRDNNATAPTMNKPRLAITCGIPALPPGLQCQRDNGESALLGSFDNHQGDLA